MNYLATTQSTFFAFYTQARVDHPRISDATSPPSELQDRHPNARWFIAPDYLSGYGVDPDGTLLGVWSTVRGRGRTLLQDALWRGASKLWCFDGYLRELYERAGFHVVSSEPNWTPGGPDVLYMQLPEAQA